MTADASTAPAQTRPALRNALARYQRPDGTGTVLGVTGPKGEVEYRRGDAVAYHSPAPRAGSQQQAPCSAYPAGCYHTDGTAAFGQAVAKMDDVAIYTALEILYSEWGAGSQPAPQRPGRPAQDARARVRTRRPPPGRPDSGPMATASSTLGSISAARQPERTTAWHPKARRRPSDRASRWTT